MHKNVLVLCSDVVHGWWERGKTLTFRIPCTLHPAEGQHITIMTNNTQEYYVLRVGIETH